MTGFSCLANGRGGLGAAAALAMLAAGCGQSGPDYTAAVHQVNQLFAEGMALDRSAAEQANDPPAACDKYRQASAKLEAAAKVMADLPAPDEEKAAAIGWASARDNVTTQRGHLDSAIKRSCTA